MWQESLLDDTTLFDAGLLACETAEIVEFCATDLAVLVDNDRVDEGRFDGEDALNADVVGHLAYGEALFVTFAGYADYNAAVLLDTLFVALFDTVSNGDGVAGEELLVLFAGFEGLFGNLD